METLFDLNPILDVISTIEEKGLQIIDELEIVIDKFNLRREILRVEKLISEEYEIMGSLLYDLHRLDKEVIISDFEDNFYRLKSHIDYLEKLKYSLEKLNRIIDEFEQLESDNDGEEVEEEMKYVFCPQCDAANEYYRAECKNCHSTL